MFGYITVNRPELKIKEADRYQSYYCGLCRELQRRHGLWGRIGLSFDMNFLVLLLTGLYEPETELTREGCILHPFVKRRCRSNCFSSYAADMNVLLMYYKCMDDWRDERKPGRALCGGLLQRNMKLLKRRYPEKVRETASALEELRRGEREGETDIDKMAGHFGRLLGAVFVYQKDVWEDELYTMGFYLGKFIYLCDAYEDIYRDVKSGSYNPFHAICRRAGFEENCEKMMTMMMAECCSAFEALPIIKNEDILRNILYSGVWRRFEQIRSRRAGGKENEG